MALENASDLLEREAAAPRAAAQPGTVARAVAPEAPARREAAAPAEGRNLDMLLDVGLKVTVELGRTRLKFRDVLNLAAGSLVELQKLTSEPVDILVNGSLLATGEVVVVDDHFAVRITRLLDRVERLKRVL